MTTPPIAPRNDNETSVVSAQTPWRVFGQVQTTKTALTPAASLTQQSGDPATSIMGSGSGPSDRYMIRPGRAIAGQYQFFGSGLATSWFQGQLIAHRQEENGTGFFQDRQILAKFRGQLGTRVGAAGFQVGASARYANVLEITGDYTPGSGVRVNTDGGVATLVLDHQGAWKIEAELAVGMGSGSGCTSICGRWAGL